MFTFLAITYNHEKYIIEHLESIKYQIETYGEGIKVQLIVADDCSKDNTTSLVNKWIEVNGYLFDDIVLLFNETNLGTVRNVINGFREISGDSFKLLAGDDLYNVYNIFEVDSLYECEMAGSYPIAITTYYEVHRKLTGFYHYRQSLSKNKTGEQIFKKISQRKGPLMAPGMFYKTHIIKNENMYEHMKKRKFLEDVMMWQYLFSMREPVAQYKDVGKPYIMYRTVVGVSQNENHELRGKFMEETESLAKDLYTSKLDSFFVKTKFHFRKMKAKVWSYKNVRIKVSNKSREAYAIHLQERAQAQAHLLYLRDRAIEFSDCIEIDEPVLDNNKEVVSTCNLSA